MEEKVGYEVMLVLASGKSQPLMAGYFLLPENAEVTADRIRSFLNLESIR